MVDRKTMVLAIVTGWLIGLCFRAVTWAPTITTPPAVPPRCVRMCVAAPDPSGCEQRCAVLVARAVARPTQTPVPARTVEGAR